MFLVLLDLVEYFFSFFFFLFSCFFFFFFFQAEDGIRDIGVTGVQTCALPIFAAMIGCKTAPRPGALAARKGDEIVVAGQFFHTGTRVVLWMDPGGYDAYREIGRASCRERV